MNSIARRWLTGGLALCLVGATVGCGDSEEAASGPAEVAMWGWGLEKDVQPLVDKFNSTHDKIRLKFVKQADNPTTQTGLRNVVAAGQGSPASSRASARPRRCWPRVSSPTSPSI